jgi:2-desacetyl-2-hydroxyethyl bacteriochlorophyllide A dehydrogenase
MPETMRAILCKNPRELEIVERPLPVRKPGEALVRIRRIGVCGTDMHIYQGNQPYFVYPRIMGHELSGEIVETEKGSTLKPGDPVYIVPYLHCGHCIACRAGRTNCCMSLKVLGVHIDGGMCEYLVVPETHLFKAEGITLDEAAMVEFLAIGAHAVARAKMSRGERALVVGSGPIGVGVAVFAALQGAEVTVIDSREDRLAFATKHLAVPHTIRLGEGDAEQMKTLTDGEFYSHVFDCTGSPKAMERGFSLVAHGGTYVLVSIVQGNISFSDPEFHKREMTLLSSRNATLADFATVMTAMRNGHIPTRAIKTHSAPLWEVAKKMPEWIRPEAGTVKAVLEIN